MSDPSLGDGATSKFDETDDEIEIVSLSPTTKETQEHYSDYSDEDDEYQSDSDEKEEDEIDRAKVAEIHEKILEEVDSGSITLATDGERHAFFESYGRYYKEINTDQSTLLHGLMGDMKRDDNVIFQRRIPLIDLIFEYDSQAPNVRDDRGETPLFIAVYKQLYTAVRYMCEKSEVAVKSLWIQNKNHDTCLHIAIQKEMELDFINYLIERIKPEELLKQGERMNPNELLKLGNKINTPLHLAVEWEKCKPSQINLVQRLVEWEPKQLGMKNGEGLSPFQHHLMTRRRSDPNKREVANSKPEPKRFKRPDVKDEVMKPMKPMRPVDLKTSYESKSRGGWDQARISSESKRRRSTPKGSIADAKQIESYLMLRCMRLSSREKVLDALYGAFQQRAIEFDLWGMKTISEVDLKRMESYLKFEVILQYVAIPRLSVSPSTSGDGNTTVARKLPQCKGRTDCCLIFDWLRACGVKQILKVIVDDEEMPSHSDEIIEMSLTGFKIEHWDWQKLDICIETILEAAPDVKVVHLYSSGNDAVLRGWTDTEGLPKLKKLELLYLVVNQGLESYQRTSAYVQNFRKRLAKTCGNIKVIEAIRKPGRPVKDRAISEKQLQQDKQRQKWLECMDNFGDFILNYPREPQEPIKVALIDDGVDTAFQDLGSIIADGISFCTRENGLYSSYYQSSGGHGTIIASLIRRVCPKVKLYVAKLDDKVTAGSAAKAISWATQKGVHIISMSWTIQKTTKNANEIDELEKAITSADKKNILMFCSASDLGNNTKKDQTISYPLKAKQDKIFHIGAATASGKGWEWIGHGEVDFIFPGEKLLLQNRLGSLPETLSGSSLATGLAAGLAALVLHCVELRGHSHFLYAKNYERMNDIFNAIGVSYKYVLVWEAFDLSREEYMDRTDEDKLERVVSRFVGKQLGLPGLARTPTGFQGRH